MKKFAALCAIAVCMASMAFTFGQEGNVPKDLLNDRIWMDGQTRNVFGYPVTRIFGNDNIANNRYHGNRFFSETNGGMLSVTNVGYVAFDDVLKDLQKAWNKHDIGLPVQKYLEDSLQKISGGGYIYVYIERPSQDEANLKYYFTVVRDQSDYKKFDEFSFPHITSQLVAGKGNWWNYYIIPMAKIPSYPFYVYVNDRQTEDLSDFKFRIDAPSFWESVVEPVRLVPDETYGLGNDWNKIFESYADVVSGKQIGKRKSLVVLPDGSVVVSHSSRNFYTLFDKDGKFVKEFVVKKDGKTMNEVKPIKGMINGNLFFTSADNMGNFTCFDVDGNFVKTLKLNFQISDMVSLGNKIAVVGSTRQSARYRCFIALVDFNTNEEKIIWDHSVDQNDLDINFLPKIVSINDQLVAGFPTLGGIMIFDNNGKLKANQKIGWMKYMSVKEQKSLKRKQIEDLKNNPPQKWDPSMNSEVYQEKVEEMIKALEKDIDNITDSIVKPAFSTIIKTSDNKLLFFEIPEKAGENRFFVRICEENGKFIGKFTFICDDYSLSITPSKMVYHDGYIYSLQDLKQAEGIPMRLVKFKVHGL